MDSLSYWWLITGVLVALELATGTFYLLMFAIGTLASAVAAHMGVGFTGQIVVAGVIGLLAAIALYQYRLRTVATQDDSDATSNLDIGQMVEVSDLASNHQTAHVQYRGAGWTARNATGSPLRLGSHKIVGVQGNQLLLEPLDS